MHLIHRGIVNKNYKENLLNSFKQSFKKGFGIETDIHATKDNKFVCYHDFTLTRIFKKKQSVKNLNYQKLKEISLKQNKPIPLLQDLLRYQKINSTYLLKLSPNSQQNCLKN
tara:strand:- start:300 stop:635 length:336 start_codon:yes stop_codon:yes gene_type:complete